MPQSSHGDFQRFLYEVPTTFRLKHSNQACFKEIRLRHGRLGMADFTFRIYGLFVKPSLFGMVLFDFLMEKRVSVEML